MVRAQYRPPLLFISFDKNSFIIPYPYPYPYPYLLSIALILYSGRLLLDYIDLSIYLLGGFISSGDPCSVLLFIGLNYFCAIRG